MRSICDNALMPYLLACSIVLPVLALALHSFDCEGCWKDRALIITVFLWLLAAGWLGQFFIE
jgi:hypothetical protein